MPAKGWIWGGHSFALKQEQNNDPIGLTLEKRATRVHTTEIYLDTSGVVRNFSRGKKKRLKNWNVFVGRYKQTINHPQDAQEHRKTTPGRSERWSENTGETPDEIAFGGQKRGLAVVGGGGGWSRRDEKLPRRNSQLNGCHKTPKGDFPPQGKKS